MNQARRVFRSFGAILLGTMILSSFGYLLGCSSAEKREEVWIEMVPGRKYTFEDIRGYVYGEKIQVRGTVVTKGRLEEGFASVVIVGRDQDGEVRTKESAPVRMTLPKQRFTTWAPYKEGLDYTIEVEGGEGFLQKAIKRVGR